MSTNTNWEHRFLNLQEDSYCLYQLKAGTLKGKAHGIVGKLLHSGTHYADYNAVYAAELNNVGNIDTSLRCIASTFSMGSPNAFGGHNISKEDMTAVKVNGKLRCYRAKGSKFKELAVFRELKNLQKQQRSDMATGTDSDYSHWLWCIKNGFTKLYLKLQVYADGYSYVIYDKAMNSKEAGFIGDNHISPLQARNKVLAEYHLSDWSIEQIECNVGENKTTK